MWYIDHHCKVSLGKYLNIWYVSLSYKDIRFRFPELYSHTWIFINVISKECLWSLSLQHQYGWAAGPLPRLTTTTTICISYPQYSFFYVSSAFLPQIFFLISSKSFVHMPFFRSYTIVCIFVLLFFFFFLLSVSFQKLFFIFLFFNFYIFSISSPEIFFSIFVPLLSYPISCPVSYLPLLHFPMRFALFFGHLFIFNIPSELLTSWHPHLYCCT